MVVQVLDHISTFLATLHNWWLIKEVSDICNHGRYYIDKGYNYRHDSVLLGFHLWPQYVINTRVINTRFSILGSYICGHSKYVINTRVIFENIFHKSKTSQLILPMWENIRIISINSCELRPIVIIFVCEKQVNVMICLRILKPANMMINLNGLRALNPGQFE